MVNLKKRALALFLGVSMAVSNMSTVYAAGIDDTSAVTAVEEVETAAESSVEIVATEDSGAEAEPTDNEQTESKSTEGTDQADLPAAVPGVTDESEKTEAAGTETAPAPAEAGKDAAEAAKPSKEADAKPAKEEKAESAAKAKTEEPVVKEPTVTVTPKDKDGKILDAVIEKYIMEHVDTTRTGSGKLGLVNMMSVQQSLFSNAVIPGDATIDSLMTYDFSDAVNGWMGSYQAVVPVYTTGDGQFYVAYANTMMDDAQASVRDVAFAHNNTLGEVVDGCYYDAATGLVYIPKSAYAAGDGTEYFNYVQVQFLQGMNESGDASDSVQSSMQVVTEEKKDVDSNTQSDNPITMTTTVQTEAGLNEDKLTVAVNGIPLEGDGYAYDAASGEVTVGVPSAAITAITVTEEPQTLAETIQEGLGNLFGIENAYAATLSDMQVTAVVGTIEIPVILQEDQQTIRQLQVGDFWYGNLWYEVSEQMLHLSSVNDTLYLYGQDPNNISNLTDLSDMARAIYRADSGLFQNNLSTNSHGYINCIAMMNKEGVATGADGRVLAYGPSTFNLYPAGAELKDLTYGNYAGPAPLSTGNLPFSSFNTMGLACGHIQQAIDGFLQQSITLPGTYYSELDGRPLDGIVVRDTAFRIMAVEPNGDENNGSATLTIGVISSSTTPNEAVGQGGVAMYRVSYKWAQEDGKVRIRKVSTEDIANNDNYSLEDTAVRVYRTEEDCKADQNPVCELVTAGTTVEDGQLCSYSDAKVLPLGTYYYKEVRAGRNMNIPADENMGTFTLTAGNMTEVLTVEVSNPPKKGSIRIEKVASVMDESTDLTGAVYTLYRGNTHDPAVDAKVGDMVIAKAGDHFYSNTIKGLEFGDGYWYMETQAPTNGKYQLDPTQYDVTIDSDELQTFTCSDDANYIFRVRKTSASATVTDGNSAYSLNGTQYGIYVSEEDAKNHTNPVFVLTVGKNGNSGTAMLTEDIRDVYWYSEIKAGTGYALDASHRKPVAIYLKDTASNPSTVKVNGTLVTITVKDEPHVEEPTDGNILVTVTKKDAGTGSAKAVGGASLGGAVFEIAYYDGYYDDVNALPEKATRTWKVQTVEKDGEYVASITNDDSFLAAESDERYVQVSTAGTEQEKIVIPCGTLKITEVKAPAGYRLPAEKTVGFTQIREDNIGTQELHAALNPEVSEEIVRGDIVIKKTSTKGGVLAGVPFAIISKTTGEMHIAVTNENGIIDTAALRAGSDGSNVNANDAAFASGRYNGTALDPAAPVYFFGAKGKAGNADLTKGALPYDTYIIRELRAEGNSSHELAADITAKISGNGESKSIDIDNTYIELRTTAADAETKSHTGSSTSDKAVIEDTVYMAGLEPGTSYTVSGSLHYKDGSAVTDKDGNAVTSSLTFTPDSSKEFKKDESANDGLAVSGTVVLTFTVDREALREGSVVVFEELYVTSKMDGEPVADHKDTGDKNQTVNYPTVGTKAVDAATKTHVGTVAKEAKVIDTVSYTGLEAGGKYVIEGKLVSSKDAKTVYATATSGEFTAEAENGNVKITFEFDATDLAGKSVVAFEKLYMITDEGKKVEIAKHENLEDKGQTVSYPTLETEAVDEATKTHTGTVAKTAKVVDRVTMTGLLKNYDYKVTGVLMDKDTKESLKDGQGNEITASAEFKTSDDEEERNGAVYDAEADAWYVDLVYELDSSMLAGKTVVVFEDLKSEDREIIAHHDWEDKEQSVYYPDVHTTAKEDGTKSNIASGTGNVKITDTVQCTNLTKGEKYIIRGYLVIKDEDEPAMSKELMVDGHPVVSEPFEFTAEKSDETHEITFPEFDAKALVLEGKNLVVFESLYQTVTKVDGDTTTTEEVLKAEHKNPTDEAQTISVPKVRTTIADAKTGDHITRAEKEATVVDTVICDNLIVGKEYTVKGTLHNKKTGEPLKGVKEETETFTAKNTHEEHKLTFKFDASLLEGETVVAFEKLYHNDIEVAVHADLKDEDQSTYIPKIGTTLIGNATRDHISEASEMLTLTDTVAYENLIPGKEYTVVGVLVDKTTGSHLTTKVKAADKDAETKDAETQDKTDETTDTTASDAESAPKDTESTPATENTESTPVAENTESTPAAENTESTDSATEPTETADVAEDAEDGKATESKDIEVPVIEDGDITATATFVAPELTEEDIAAGRKTVSGTCNIEFKLNASLLEGRTIVAFETLYYENNPIAVHADIEDEGQSVHVPKIRTTLKDNETGEHITKASEKAVVTDTVQYHNLIPGKEYTVSGELVVKPENNTGTAVLNDGEPAAKDATVTMTVISDKDAKPVEGAEKLIQSFKAGEKIILTDVPAGWYMVEIKYAETEDKTETADNTEEQTTTETNTDSTELIDPSYISFPMEVPKSIPEKSVIATGQQTFVADNADGSVDITFTFDASALAGRTAVAFETLTWNGITVATHADIDDEEQSTHIPKVKTTLVDVNTKNHITNAEKDRTVIDTVYYDNLVVGKEYVVTGTLMDKATKKEVVNGNKAVTSTTKFTAQQPSGYVELKFTFDATAYAGTTVVAFEKLYHNDKEIAVHADINDEDQSTYVPKIGTTASINGAKTVTAGATVTLTDVVTYTNLIPNAEYTVTGTVMDKSTGKAFTQNGKPVTMTKTFKPEKADGSITLSTSINTSGLSDTTLVVFEEITMKVETVGTDGKKTVTNEEVGKHKDLKDAAQTVNITKKPTSTITPKPGTSTSRVQTGDTVLPFVFGGLFILAIFAIVIALYNMNRKRTHM